MNCILSTSQQIIAVPHLPNSTFRPPVVDELKAGGHLGGEPCGEGCVTQKRRTFHHHFIRYPPSLQDSHTSYNASHTSKASQTYQISQTIFLILVSHRLPLVVSDQSRLYCQFFSVSFSTNTYRLEASRQVTKVVSTPPSYLLA